MDTCIPQGTCSPRQRCIPPQWQNPSGERSRPPSGARYRMHCDQTPQQSLCRLQARHPAKIIHRPKSLKKIWDNAHIQKSSFSPMRYGLGADIIAEMHTVISSMVLVKHVEIWSSLCPPPSSSPTRRHGGQSGCPLWRCVTQPTFTCQLSTVHIDSGMSASTSTLAYRARFRS